MITVDLSNNDVLMQSIHVVFIHSFAELPFGTSVKLWLNIFTACIWKYGNSAKKKSKRRTKRSKRWLWSDWNLSIIFFFMSFGWKTCCGKLFHSQLLKKMISTWQTKKTKKSVEQQQQQQQKKRKKWLYGCWANLLSGIYIGYLRILFAATW